MVIFFEISMDIGWTKNEKFQNCKGTFLDIYKYMTLAKEVSMINLDMFGNEIME